MAKIKAFYLLIFCTIIYLYFPICYLMGNEVCWRIDMVEHGKTLMVASAVILSLCFWVWYKMAKDPEMKTSSGKPVAVLVVAVSVIVGLIILIFGTSPYWAPLVGQ